MAKDFDLGNATSYSYYVSEGGTKSPEEFGEMLVNIDTVATRAETSASNAAESEENADQSKTAAQAAAGIATTKAAEASQSATAAANAASAAQADADAAAIDASQAMSAASTATSKATEAASSASTATTAKNDAVTAKAAAQAAQTAAETAEDNAETSATAAAASAASVAGSAAQITQNTTDISQLKSDLSELYTVDKFTKPSGGGQVYEYGISAGTTYWFTNLTNNNSVNVRTCTSDGTEIENVKNGFAFNETVEFSATQNASYIRIYSGVNDTTVSVGTYGPRLIELNDKVDSTNETLTKAKEEALDLLGYEWDVGHFIGNTGTPGNATDRACTDFIPCKPLVSITYVGENNNANVCGIAFYNKYFQYISGDINSGTLGEPVTVTSPAETAYFRMSTKLPMLGDSYFTYNGDKNSALMAVSQRAVNATVYVDGLNGSDTTGNGMPTKPFKTIQHAIDLGATKIGIFPTPVYSETLNAYGGDLHLFAYITLWGYGSNPNRIRAKLNGNNSVATILTVENADRVVLEDLEIYNCTGDGCLLNMCNNVEMINCAFHDNGNNGVVINYTNGVFRDCSAYSNGHDGFNLNYYGDTQFYNCSGFNNGDDGISHHQGTTGLIDGGEWYGNTKGGVASPCYGARVDIRNVYSHDNGYGIYAFAAGASDARSFKVWNCVLTNNSNYGIAVKYNTPYIYKNKIAGNTVGQTTAYGTAEFHVLD